MELQHAHSMGGGEQSPKEIAKFISVLIGITLVSVVLWKFTQGHSLQDWMRWFMGVFFLVFGSFKLVGYKMFVDMFAGYDVVAKRFKSYSYAYPFIELALALAYLGNQLSPERDWATLIIMVVGTIGVAHEIKRRTGIHCACLGNVIKLPLSTVSLVEDLGMGLMALVMIVGR